MYKLSWNMSRVIRSIALSGFDQNRSLYIDRFVSKSAVFKFNANCRIWSI